MPNKEFLEIYPLYKKFKFSVPSTLREIPKVAINMFCNNCKSNQTFTMSNEYEDTFRYSNYPSSNEKVPLIYYCSSCQNYSRQFLIYISPNLDYIYKCGQYPQYEIKIDKQIEKILGNHSSNYKKGLICESQGYGIAAFAYYRKITEEIIDELLDSIADLIDSQNKDKYSEALKKTKATRVTQEKIELVKDLLPEILRPQGMNPLGVLHSELSQGLHNESDEECLEKAGHIKEILSFLINQIIISKESSKQFTDSMRSLLDKKAERS